ncbi:hypothetical protein V1478_008785 [Vespula squamosa]|uniref:Uncharacterized protein n=1 Tax=Vespula squamosa TaxID=30214 RepID=A0ABD2AUH8_VESSQ
MLYTPPPAVRLAPRDFTSETFRGFRGELFRKTRWWEVEGSGGAKEGQRYSHPFLKVEYLEKFVRNQHRANNCTF